MPERLKHIKYIIDNYSSQLIAGLNAEGINITVEGAMDIFIASDPSQDKKLVDWLVKTYIAKGFRWEDIETGIESKLAEVLNLYKTNFAQIPRDKRNIYQYRSYGELYTLLEPFNNQWIDNQGLLTENTPGSREIRRQERAKALEASEVLYRSEDMIVAVPLTKEASVWWGRGTKWCTAAYKNNYFDYYNKNAPLIVITLMNQNPNSSKNAEKFQVWAHRDDVQFMDARDCEVDSAILNKHWNRFEPVVLAMLERNGWLIKFVPENLRTCDICRLAVEKDGITLYFVPDQLKTFELCLIAVKQNSFALRDVPEKFRTKELCTLAFEKRPGLDIIDHIPKKIISYEFSKFLLKQSGLVLNYIPSKLRTPELYRIAVKQNGMSLGYIPAEDKTIEICRLAVEQNGMALKYVPVEFRTIDICKVAVKQCGESLYCVPQAIIDEELCRLALEQDISSISCVPDKYLTAELCKQAVEKNGTLLHYVPKQYKTNEIIKIAIEQNGMALDCLPLKQRTMDLCRLAIEKDGWALAHIPNNMITPEICWLAVNKNWETIRYVPDCFLTDELLSIAQINNSSNWNRNLLDDIKESINKITDGNISDINSSNGLTV